MDSLKFIAPIVGACALIVALILAKWISGQPVGNARMKEISGFIHEGAMAFLGREYRTMVIVVVVLAVILGFALSWEPRSFTFSARHSQFLPVISECRLQQKVMSALRQLQKTAE